MLGVRETDVQRIGLSVQLQGLPWAGAGDRKPAGDASTEAEPDGRNQQKVEKVREQAAHGRDALTQRVEGEEEGEGQCQASKDQDILLPGC
ncbi:MAG: Uncharacterised protein [Prochlorococcus marinus str. MIT 9313]|nr:MAG: Uncharacterised protein [Prochlorococcus marinus str. MIT 9313]